MGIFRSKPGAEFEGLRVQVQIGGKVHCEYFSFKGLSNREIRRVEAEAEERHKLLQARKREHHIKTLFSQNSRTLPKRDFGLTGLQLAYSVPQRGDKATPYLRVLTGREGGRVKSKAFGILSRGVDAAWLMAIEEWAGVNDLSVELKSRALREHKPGMKQFAALAKDIREAGLEINWERWVRAGIAE